MLRVKTVFSGMSGAPWLNTLYFDDATLGAQDCVDAVATFWSAVDGLMDSEVDWDIDQDVEIVDEASGNVLSIVQTTGGTGSGSLAAEALPIASQALIRWRTGVYVGGREIRGRTFVPGLTEQANDNGKLAAASQTLIQTAATALINDPDCDLAIYSRVNANAAPVVSANVWGEFAVMRSRRD